MTARQIQLEVAAKHGVSHADMLTKGNYPKLVDARNEAMARCRDELAMSYQEIGRLFAKHHTTVMHSIRQFAAAKPRRKAPERQRESLEAVVIRQAAMIGDLSRMVTSLSAELERYRRREMSGQAELFAVRRSA